MLSIHQPVLLKEVISYLQVQPGEAYLDATIGGAGHSRAIIAAGGRVFGIDHDPQALKLARSRLEQACPGGFWQLELANFKDLIQVFKGIKFKGILFDLGMSSDQLADSGRGFAFSQAGPLDMRMDPDLGVTAADLLKALSKRELTQLFKKFGQERLALKIAEAIIDQRQQQPIETSQQLAALIEGVYGGRRGKIHPATKVFQALRIVVNDELNNLTQALPAAVERLSPGGRLVVISFHGLEDRIVKQFLKTNNQLTILTKKPIVPQVEEIEINPRSRSAKLRVAEKQK